MLKLSKKFTLLTVTTGPNLWKELLLNNFSFNIVIAYPLNYSSFLYKLSRFLIEFTNVVKGTTSSYFAEQKSFPSFIKTNSNLWGDGFLFDFLQKKTLDIWVRKFVIYTGFLFSERLVFDTVYRVYIDLLLNPLRKLTPFETSSVSEVILITLFTYLTLFILLTLLLLLF